MLFDENMPPTAAGGKGGLVPATPAPTGTSFFADDGTFKAVTNAVAATNAEAAAGTSTTTFVTPANAQYAVANKTNALAPAQALSFNGTAGATIAALPALGTGNFWVSVRVNPSALGSVQAVVAGLTNSFGLLIDATGHPYTLTVANVPNTAATGTIAAGVTSQIDYVRSGTTGTYYINGVAAGTTTDAQNYSVASTYLGNYGTPNYYFTGTLRLLGIANQALSAAEVLQLYQTGIFPASLGLLCCPDPTQLGSGTSWYDVSGNAAHITIGSGVEWVNKWSGKLPSSIVDGTLKVLTLAKVGSVTGTTDSTLHVYESSAAGTGNGITVEQAGAGDAVTQYLLTGGQRWSAGIDNSDSDAYVISAGALGTNNVLRATSADISFLSTSAIKGVRTATHTPAIGSLTAGSGATTNVTVTGAAIGDAVTVNSTDGSGIGDVWKVTAQVTATNTVSIRVVNIGTTTQTSYTQPLRVTVTSF